MKKNLIYAGMLLLCMMVATSCSNEESLEQVANNGKTIQAVIEKVVARTSVSDNYEVLWTENDQFDVWGETSKVGTLVLKSGEGTTSGSFGLVGTESFDVTDGMTAFYPSNSNNAKAYTFAESYTNQITNAPMVGTFTNGKFTFSLLTAMVRVVVTNVPVGDAVLTITSSDKNLTGEVTLANDGTLGVPTGNGKTVIVTVANNTSSTLTFDVPVPVQEYTNGLNATLKVAEEEIFNKTTNGFTAEVGKLYKFDADASVVTNPGELENALSNGSNIILGDDITLGSTGLTISGGTTATIDLNGNSLDLNGQLITLGEGSTLNLVNNANSTVGRNVGTNVTVLSTSDIIKAAANSTINIGESVNLETSGTSSCCIWIPRYAENVVVNSQGNLKCTAAGAAVISHNGYLTSGEINIIGGSVIHDADVAIYIAGKAELNISGDAVIEGVTGVEIRGGSLEISGGAIKGWGNPESATPNGNGTTTVGAAVAISQHTTNHAITATISGGTFTGINALYEADLHADNQVATEMTLSVTGGTFDGKVSSKSCSNFIAGGTFSDASAFDFLADEAEITLGADMTIAKAITIPTGVTATVDLNGFNVTALNTDAFEVQGTLTIEGTDESVVKAGTLKAETGSVCAVWAHNGGNVTINNGHYIVYEDKDGKRNDCIYAGSNAQHTSGTITINGGKFEYGSAVTQTGVHYNGHLFLLNCADTQPESMITVNSGSFKNHVPSFEPNGTDEVVLGANLSVYNASTQVTAPHSGTEDVWYEVK